MGWHPNEGEVLRLCLPVRVTARRKPRVTRGGKSGPDKRTGFIPLLEPGAGVHSLEHSAGGCGYNRHHTSACFSLVFAANATSFPTAGSGDNQQFSPRDTAVLDHATPAREQQSNPTQTHGANRCSGMVYTGLCLGGTLQGCHKQRWWLLLIHTTRLAPKGIHPGQTSSHLVVVLGCAVQPTQQPVVQTADTDDKHHKKIAHYMCTRVTDASYSSATTREARATREVACQTRAGDGTPASEREGEC